MSDEESVVDVTPESVAPDEVTEDAVADDAVDEVKSLEEEGELAADYIEELLDICDLDGDIDIDVRQGRAYVAVSSGEDDANLGILGSGDAVQALQELTRLAVQNQTGHYSRLILDVQHSRERRSAELETLIDAALAAFDAGDDAFALEPMSSYERKLIHDMAAERGLTSESEGQGRDRHIVLRRAAE